MVNISRFSARQKIGAAAVLILGAGAVVGFKKYRKPASSPSGLVLVSRGDLELHFMDSGEITPKHGVHIASKVSGRVIEMRVEEGARVKKGDTLAVIQPGRTEAEQYVPVAIASPINGVVMRHQKEGNYQEEGRIAKLGDYVTGLFESNDPSYLMTVADLSRLIVKMKISEMDILKLSEGMAVKVTIDAIAGASFPAKVTLVSPRAEKDSNNLKNFKVEVTLSQSDARLKPGMTARVDGLLEARKNVLKMPLSALFEEAGKEFVYLKNAAGKADKTPLKLGLRNETDAEVTEGPKEGSELFTEKPVEEKKS